MTVETVEIIERIKTCKGISTDKDLASELGLTASNFNMKKKRDSPLITEAVEWALKNKINIHWILTGEGPKYLGDTGPSKSSAILDVDMLLRLFPEVREQLEWLQEALVIVTEKEAIVPFDLQVITVFVEKLSEKMKEHWRKEGKDD